MLNMKHKAWVYCACCSRLHGRKLKRETHRIIRREARREERAALGESTTVASTSAKMGVRVEGEKLPKFIEDVIFNCVSQRGPMRDEVRSSILRYGSDREAAARKAALEEAAKVAESAKPSWNRNDMAEAIRALLSPPRGG